MICPRCSSDMTDDGHYCPQCGEPTTLSEEVSAATVVATFVTGETKATPFSQEKESASLFSSTQHSQSLAQMGYLVPVLDTPNQEAKREPNEEEIHALLQQAHLSLLRKHWTEAIDSCVAVLRLEPGNQAAHSLLGDIYRGQGKMEDALQWYRMAVDFAPNPSDEKKLREVENERLWLTKAADRQARTAGQSAVALLPAGADGTAPLGTTALMGYSPRDWLRWITVISLVFVGVMVFALILSEVRSQNKSIDPIPRPMAGEPFASASTQSSLLPPPKLGGSSLTGGNRGGTSGGSADEGLRPDATSTTNTTIPVSPKAASPNPAPLGVPPASVKSLSSMDSAPNGNGDSTNNAENNTPPGRVGSALPGGMKLTQVQPEGNEGVTIYLATPLPTSTKPSPEQRALLIRNIYRAAATVLDVNPALNQITVVVRSGNTPLVSAQLDKATALNADPELDAVERLESHLRAVQWAGEAPGQGSSSPGGED